MTILKRLFSEGFRIFFLTACVFALVAIGVWVTYLARVYAGGSPDFAPAMVPMQWHSHEMIFGYGGAALAGFFMTAVPNWTGAKGAPARFMAVVFGLWLAGRLAIWWSGALPAPLVAAADLSFMPVLAFKMATLLLKAPKPQQMIFLLTLALVWAANLSCHLEWLGVIANGVEPGLRAGLFGLVAMILILGGRVTPGFTRNAMVSSGREDRLPRNPAALAVISAAPALALGPAILAGLPAYVLAALAGVAGTVALVRLALWRGAWTLSRPILWTMHLSYGFAGVGLLAWAAATLNLLPELSALHVLGIGAVGGMTLSILTRASLGHAGRPLVAPRPVALAYGLMPLATLARCAAAEYDAVAVPGTLIAGALWLVSFALVLAVFWPIWRDARPPRKPVRPPPA